MEKPKKPKPEAVKKPAPVHSQTTTHLPEESEESFIAGKPVEQLKKNSAQKKSAKTYSHSEKNTKELEDAFSLPQEHFDTHSGFVAIMGRPNVGKSTLLNSILGEKLSIISPKPQTTRHRILGVKTGKGIQVIYVDTPGLHLGEQRAINRYMNQAARRALKDVDVIIFVVDGLIFTEEDEMVLKLVSQAHCPVILAVNKVDEISEKAKLLPHLKALSEEFEFSEIIPISAKTGDNVGSLERKVAALLPEGPYYFPEGQITDRTLQFRLSEIIREKLMFYLEQEVPYGTTVEIESLEEEERRTIIHAVIWVDRPGHKPIVIGKQGAMLKKIGIESRKDMEALLDKPVHLKLWVKVKGGWSDNDRALKNLGYRDV